MKFIVPQKLLASALASVMPVVPKETKIPALREVLFELSKGLLRITTTDLECTIMRVIPAAMEKPGKATFSAEKIYSLIKNLPSTELSISMGDSNRLVIKTEQGEYRIAGNDPEEFPVVAHELASDVKFACEASKLNRFVNACSFAVSTDELRRTLMGVLFDVQLNELRVVATNGHRLVKIVDHNFSASGQAKAIVPVKALAALQKISDDEVVDVSIGDSMIIFKIGEITLYSKLISGKYPDYERVIPQGYSNAILNVDASIMSQTLRRADLFSAEHTHQIRLAFLENEMQVNAARQEGESEERLALDGGAKDEFVFGCSAAYFLKILNHLPFEQVDLHYQDSDSALLLKPSTMPEGEDVLAVLMPIRLEN